jgi:hypothetical protein
MMAAVAEPPQRRVVVPDARANGHHLQVTWHAECDQFVVSLWREDTCVASARLRAVDAGDVAAFLQAALEGGVDDPPDAGGRVRRGQLGGRK